MAEQYLPSEAALYAGDHIVASYYVEVDHGTDLDRIAQKFAVGQTIGTWTPVPGIDERMRREHMGKVVDIKLIPPVELSTGFADRRAAVVSVAFPHRNFGGSIAMLLTTLLGNDASTSIQAKLVDLILPAEFVQGFSGPRFGIEGLRNLTGVYDRPLVLNMIKPCLGFPPEVGARIFYDCALGGVDIIKDDELLGSPDICQLEERVSRYREASLKVYETTGKRTLYFANVTGVLNPREYHRIRRAVELGADGIMVNVIFAGFDSLAALAADPDINVPVLVHYAGTGSLSEGVLNGIDSAIILGKLARIAGGDIVLFNTPYGGYPYPREKYIILANLLRSYMNEVKRTFPAVGGGVIPAVVPRFIRELGRDIVIAVGGAIQGHPMGSTAGARAMMQAVAASVAEKDLNEAAREHEELRVALDLWRV